LLQHFEQKLESKVDEVEKLDAENQNLRYQIVTEQEKCTNLNSRIESQMLRIR
jgi:peptidoglycan hydrolase CwlO-like protein